VSNQKPGNELYNIEDYALLKYKILMSNSVIINDGHDVKRSQFLPINPICQIDILINKDNWKATVATLSHEYGHYQSWQNGTIYDNSYTSSLLLILEECRAWIYGFKFLKENEIKVDFSMRWIAIKSIYSHALYLLKRCSA
jgi:hypothetical protein